MWRTNGKSKFEVITWLERTARLIGFITLEMTLTVKAQCGKSARWICRGGGWKWALKYRASLRSYYLWSLGVGLPWATRRSTRRVLF